MLCAIFFGHPGCKFIEPINDLAVAATLTCRARAEKQGFNVTLERSFDPAAGQADVFPTGHHAGTFKPDLKQLLCSDEA